MSKRGYEKKKGKGAKVREKGWVKMERRRKRRERRERGQPANQSSNQKKKKKKAMNQVIYTTN